MGRAAAVVAATRPREEREFDFLAPEPGEWAKIDAAPLRVLRSSAAKDYKPRKHLVIPDTQAKPGAPDDHMEWAGRYAADKRPDVIVHLGDHWDMPSLSSWDRGRKDAENRRYRLDIAAGNRALDRFMRPIFDVNKGVRKGKQYRPRLVYTLGNHEDRIARWAQTEPAMDGLVGYHHFNLERHGWEVHPFLVPVVIDGIKYAHFHPRGASGRITQTRRGAPSARIMVQREGMSCTAGHMQGLDWAPLHRGHTTHYGLIAGSYYLHAEAYLTPVGNIHWCGLVMKHEVHEGQYDPMFVSIEYLSRRYS